MILQTTLLWCRELKTDEQLKAIMKRYMCYVTCAYGFYNDTKPISADIFKDNLPDDLYVEGGIKLSGKEDRADAPEWLDRADAPFDLRTLEDQDAWWADICKLDNIPPGYFCHRVIYGVPEDEEGYPALEKGWQDALKDEFGERRHLAGN